MNIVTPVPTAIPFTTSNVNTESARRDNALRETIPQVSQTENSAAESGLGSESDRIKKNAQLNQPITYERPTPQQSQGEAQEGAFAGRDNGEDPSAGKESAEQQQKQAQEKREVQELKARDREVRAHEQAHAAVGGEYAGSPSYEFETGPDGQQYAVGGEVSIDISEESDPQETLQKMQQVRAAALAPNDPSPQDLRVAGEASRKASEARADIAEDNNEARLESIEKVFEGEPGGSAINEPPALDDIVDGGAVGAPTRRLEEDSDPVAEAVGLETSGDEFKQQLASRSAEILKRVDVISGFYQQATEPRASGFQQTA
ncbi:MAG: putative metalloprotease CJM1_0395 family protein [Aestuariibacter sp.]